MKTITINKKEYGVLFGAHHLKYLEQGGFSDTLGDNFVELKNRYLIVLAGVKNWCDLKNIECDIDLVDIAGWADSHPKELNDVIDCWNNSLVAGKPINEFAEDLAHEAKKNRKPLRGKRLRNFL